VSRALDFYEHKHRAIQSMVDPAEDGGLGPRPSDRRCDGRPRRRRLSHRTVYTKLAQRRAIARAQRAMDAYRQGRDAADAERPSLKIVREAG
jgi:hypothetical protein